MPWTLPRFVTALFLTLVLIPSPAHAADDEAPAEAPSLSERVDAWFGNNVNGPLFSVLFFDLVFWDDDLPLGEGVGQTVGDEVITDFRDGSYVYQEQVELPVSTPKVLHTGNTETLQSGLKIEVLDAATGLVKVDAGPAPAGEFATTPLSDWNRAPISLADPAWAEVLVDGEHLSADRLQAARDVGATFIVTGGETTALALDAGTATLHVGPEVGVSVLTGLADFPVLVDAQGQLISVTGVLTSGIPATIDDEVRVDGQKATVLARRGDALQARMLASRLDDTPLKNPSALSLPFIVAWLVMGAVFFTLRMQFINLRGFWHAIEVTSGKFDNPDEDGEISHFQALASALSATVGLGNIAGVAVAVGTGGPGAIFWMVTAGFLGMSSKFTECTLGQMYRQIDERGHVSGGPFRYLSAGLADLGLGGLGKGLSVLFAVMCVGGSFGGGNMFQSNQAVAQLTGVFPSLAGNELAMGIGLALLVGLVIIGGIKRIGAAAGIIVPLMCAVYVLAGLWILVAHAADVPAAFATIVGEAFSPKALGGGFIGVLVVGFQRAAFSNEAGVGSASIAHSAATTQEPVREGIVALLEPFIDTIIVCTMTGLVVVITGAYQSGESDGVRMTSEAFGSVISWFPYLLSLAVLLFAFSTMISWSYYGERSWTYLFGPGSAMLYKVIFLVMSVLGAVLKLGSVIDFSDAMILGMAFPNILGAVLLSGRVREALDDYWTRYKKGEFVRQG